MKAFRQAPVVGYTLPSSQKAHVFFSSGPYHHSSHQYKLVASNDNLMYKKHKRLMVTSSSLYGMSSEMLPESAWDICKGSSSESLKNIKDAEQEVAAQDIDARFIESIVFDKTLYKYEILDRKTSTVKIMKQQGLMSAGNEDEILCALDKIEQDIVQEKFEWRDDQDVHTNIMEALVNLVGERAKKLTTPTKSDRCLFVLKTWCKDCVEPIDTRIKQIQVALMSLAIRLVLTGNQKTEDNTSLESIILPIVKALDHAANDLRSYHHLLTSSISFGCPETDSYYDRCQIGYIGDRINYDVPEILIHMVKTFVSWRNLPSFIPNYEVVTYDTFLEKFLPNGRTDDGFFALDNCLNISSFCATDHFDIEDARFFLFSRFEQVVEMLDLCIKFAEGISFSQESCPPTGRCDAISLSRFLRNKGFSLETSYGLVGLCLKKQCQPGELTPQQLQGVGFPCDSLEDIHEARSLLQGKQIVFDNSLTNHDSLLAKLLFWCYNLEMEPQVFC